MTRHWRKLPLLGLAAISLSACIAGPGGSKTGQNDQGPFLYQNRGVAHAPAVKQVDAASYNAVLGDRYWPQPGEFFYFKQVGVMVGNNGFRASRDGGAFWVTFGHSATAEEAHNFFSGGAIDHSEVVAIPPGQTRTYTAGEAVMTITTPGDIAREDEILVVVERGVAPMDNFGDPNNQAYVPPQNPQHNQNFGHQGDGYQPSGFTPQPQYGATPNGFSVQNQTAYGAPY